MNIVRRVTRHEQVAGPIQSQSVWQASHVFGVNLGISSHDVDSKDAVRVAFHQKQMLFISADREPVRIAERIADGFGSSILRES